MVGSDDDVVSLASSASVEVASEVVAGASDAIIGGPITVVVAVLVEVGVEVGALATTSGVVASSVVVVVIAAASLSPLLVVTTAPVSSSARAITKGFS